MAGQVDEWTGSTLIPGQLGCEGWRVGGIGARGTWDQLLPALVSAPFEGVLFPNCPSLGSP